MNGVKLRWLEPSIVIDHADMDGVRSCWLRPCIVLNHADKDEVRPCLCWKVSETLRDYAVVRLGRDEGHGIPSCSQTDVTIKEDTELQQCSNCSDLAEEQLLLFWHPPHTDSW